MLAQLHAYYIILQAFTVDFMQLQSLHASSVGPRDFEIRFTIIVSCTAARRAHAGLIAAPAAPRRRERAARADACVPACRGARLGYGRAAAASTDSTELHCPGPARGRCLQRRTVA